MFVVVTVVEMLATSASRASRGGLIRRVGGEGAAAYRSQLRAIENAGVGIGAVLGGVALTLNTLAAYQVLFLVMAATFLIGAWVCAGSRASRRCRLRPVRGAGWPCGIDRSSPTRFSTG